MASLLRYVLMCVYLIWLVIWDPNHHKNIQLQEKIQCRATSWILNDFSQDSSTEAENME